MIPLLFQEINKILRLAAHNKTHLTYPIEMLAFPVMTEQ